MTAPQSGLPSIHSSQYQATNTETHRVTQSTMRLEHKTPLNDIEPLSYTPKSYTPNQLPNYDRTAAPFVAPGASSVPQHQTSSNLYGIASGLDYPTAAAEQPKYSKFDHTQTPQAIFYNPNKTSDNDNFTYHQREEFRKLNLTPGPQPEFGTMPKSEDTKKECISDRIKKLESSYKEVSSAPQGGVKILPFGSSQHVQQQQHHTYSSTLTRQINDIPPLSKPSAFNGFTTPSPRPPTGTEEEDVGELKRQTIKETAKAFDHKISEYKGSSNDYQLKAPGLVRTIFPSPAPRERPKSFHGFPPTNLNLLTPEPEPEMLYAPRPAYERHSSLVETIEQSLEKDFEKPPTRVIPGAVRMMPPSPLHSVPDHSTPVAKQWPPKATSGYAADAEDTNYYASNHAQSYESRSNRQCYEKVGEVVVVYVLCCCVLCVCVPNIIDQFAVY